MQRQGAGLLALALAAVTAVSTVGVAAPVAAAPAAPASAPVAAAARVVVSAAGTGALGVAAAADAVVAAGGRVLDRLPLVGGVAAELPAGAVLAPGLTVSPDRPIRLSSTADTAAPPAAGVGVRKALGMDTVLDEGKGVLVAVVDTGVAPHPDLAGRLTSVNVTGRETGDGYGHGTFVAGLVAGSGAKDPQYAGIAPAAEVLDVRVADAEGTTNLVTVLRGLEVAHAAGADVVNLSLSSYSPLPYQIDPLVAALEVMWRGGTVVVVPAGNDGPKASTITSPGVSPTLLTVGAVDTTTGTVPDFSARGPAPQDVDKPDLVAAGRSVVSLRAAGSVIDRTHGASGAVGEHYFKGSGTSFSTAVVSGAAAVLRAQNGWTPEQVKQAVTDTAVRGDDVNAWGKGALDLTAALTATVDPATAPEPAPGKGKGNSQLAPGSKGEWQPLQRALLAGNQGLAASSWSRMSPEVRNWAASSWSSLSPELRDALVAEWTVRNWAGDPEDWAEMDWAVRNWAVRNWAVRNWAASSWSVRNWADTEGDWLAGWNGRNWAASSWSGRNWAGRNWAASSWSGRNWAGRNWASIAEWADQDGSASGWAASSWSARNWAVDGWE